MDQSTLNKVQHKLWVTKQTVYRKLGKKEDDCIVASDAELDAKLELFKSVQQTSSAMNKLLDRYQERICYVAQEQNAMGRFLKAHGKQDKSAAGKMMIQMGKSLIYCSQQEIAFRPPLLRLYQEVETFRNRAIDDTLETIQQMEKVRTEYRASLNWMKKVSQELDPDTYKQMEKFRKVQTHVKGSKSKFDKLKLACLQKVDLLAAARCNMFSHALIQYQTMTVNVTAKNAHVFETLANTFKGHQHYEFSFVKELAAPSRKLAKECGTKEPTEELLFDFNDELNLNDGLEGSKDTEGQSTEEKAMKATETKMKRERNREADLLDSETASELLENLLGSIDLSPETEKAQDALNLGLDNLQGASSSSDPGDKTSQLPPSLLSMGSFMAKPKDAKRDKEKDVMDLLTSDELDSIPFENDTIALLNELLSTNQDPIPNSQTLLAGLQPIPTATDPSSNVNLLSGETNVGNTFLPSQLLDLANLDMTSERDNDLLNLATPLDPKQNAVASKKLDIKGSGSNAKSWYDIFADLDPIANPDAIGNRMDGDNKVTEENRYC